MISPEAGAKGERYQTAILSGFQYDQGRMDAQVNKFSNWKPTQEWCNSMAMSIASKEQQIALQNRATAQSQQDWANALKPTPIQLPVVAPTVQPTFGATSGEQYQTIAVNTPNGLVYKRCKVLNGQIGACF